MIKVEAYKDFDQSEWRSVIMSLEGNVFHLPEVWLPENEASAVRYLVFTAESKIVGACVGVCQGKRFLKLVKSSDTLFLPTVPAISREDGGEDQDIYDALIGFSAQAGFKTLTVGVRWGSDFSGNPKLSEFINQHLIEFTIDLRRDMDAIIKSFHKKHRKNIRKAESSSISIITDNSLEGFLDLRKLQEASSVRASTKGNVYQLQNDKHYIDAHRNIYQKGLGTVMFARKDGKTVAGLAYLFFGHKAVTVRSGATPEGYALCAPYYLQYELIRRIREEGYSILDIGGVPKDAVDPSHPQHGLYQFKKGFGALPNLRTGLSICLR
ncbi:MAG: lipid II:glycine glycyltransferase FemX [Candidatus Hodarchaeota archaeon]